MKILFLLAPTFFLQAQAQNLEQSFQQEYVYLSSQKESLHRQKKQMETSFDKRIRKSKATVNEMARQLTQITAANDDRHEQLVQLEKQKKEIAKRGTSIEATYKKASSFLSDFERQLRFENVKDSEKKNPVPPDDLIVGHLEPLFAKADQLLRSSARSEKFTGYYQDSHDELKKGEVIRLGRVAAFLNDGGDRVLLGPSGTGTLKTLEKTGRTETFIFENMNEAARVEKAATLVERLADASPIVFLGLMLLMVAGLFVALVRI